jgi:hypothetical protein
VAKAPTDLPNIIAEWPRRLAGDHDRPALIVLVVPNKLTRVGRSSSTRVVQLTTNTRHMAMIRDDRFG